MNTFVVEPIFDSVGLAIFLVVGGFFLVASLGVPSEGLTDRQRHWLVGLRLGALAILALTLLRPTIVRSDSRPAPAVLAILLDESRSMGLPDGDGQSRWESQSRVVRELIEGLDGFDEQLQIQWYAYGNDTSLFETVPGEGWLTSKPDAPQTDYALALRRAVEGAAGKPMAGIVLAGDGTLTKADSNPVSVARTLAALDVPLWTVPLGPRNTSDQMRDVAVSELSETFSVFSKNSFRIRFVIQARGMVGSDIPIEIALVDAANQRQEIATRTLVAESTDTTLPVDLELQAPAPGGYQLEVRVPSQVGEKLTENNYQVAFLDVREGGGRVLYLEGEPRLEQLFLRRAINASPDLELSFQLISKGSQGKWPIDLGLAGGSSKADVYVIGDLDSTALGEANLRSIAEDVDAGSGLLMIGGAHTFELGGYATSPIADLLPIRMDPAKRININQDPPANTMIPSPVKARPKRPHPLTQIDSAEGNDRAWESLKPLLGANRFGALKIAPGIEVLLESTNQEPLLVVGQSGAGRIALFAGDTTWQWWRQQKSDYHRRFWRQMMLWLLAREDHVEDSLWIQLDSRRFERGSPSAFTVGAGESVNPVTSQLTAEVIDSLGKKTPVSLTRASVLPESAVPRQRLATGVIPDLPGGVYRLRVFDQDNTESVLSSEQLFQVIDIDAEMSRPQAEISRLEQLSSLTEPAGGRSFRVDEVNSLIDQIKSVRRRAELPVVEQFRLGDGPVSGWILMVSMLGLLSAEWFLRKRWHQA